VLARKAQELAQLGARGPFRNFIAVLEFWVQDISGTAKDFGTAQCLTVEPSAAEDFERGKATVASWCVVVQPHGIIHGEGPKANVVLVQPLDGQVNHHGPCHILDGFYSPFGGTILVVCANARDSMALVGSKEGVAKLGLCEDPIVGVVVGH